MKNNLLNIVLILGICSCVKGQQIISFEVEEGFNETILDAQQGWNVWSTWGEFSGSSAGYDSSVFTHGKRSAYLESSGFEMDWCGVDKNISALADTKTEITFDYKFDEIGLSNYGIDIYKDIDFDITASLQIDYTEGRVYYYDQSSGYEEGELLEPNRWYEIKFVINKATNKVQYFIDGNLKYETELGDIKEVGILDFTFDDYGSGFHFDNIRIVGEGASLSSSNADHQTDVKLYPNPVSEKLYFNNVSNLNEVKIFDANGKLIIVSSNELSDGIDVSQLPKGNYLLVMKSENKVVSKKFIKK